MDCIFCELIRGGNAKWIARQADAVAFLPLPETSLAPGHTLVAPRVHCTGILDAPHHSLAAVMILAQHVGRAMQRTLNATGIVVLNASGLNSGQSVPHLHLHVVPRWPDCQTGMWPERPSQHVVEGDAGQLLARAF